MDSLWNTVTPNHNLIKLINGRQHKQGVSKRLVSNCQFTPSLLQRLDLEHTLDGHQGCVNCLQWSSDGRILASGSDDTHVRIWDPFVNKCLHIVPTKHIGNIFSVKFVGDGSLVATGAGDCRVMVQSIEDSDRHAHIDCSCHFGRVKRLAVAPDQPSLFWSAAEDGLIMQYDLREPHECIKKSTVFLDMSYGVEFKCIAVNPTRPHLIATGANDSYVRVYDRRLIKPTKMKPNSDARKRLPPEPQDPNCVQYFAPGHLAKDNGGEHSFKLAATYVAFDSSGNDLLVNMGGEHIYLFNINNNRHIHELLLPECLPKTKKNLQTVKSCCILENRQLDKGVHKYNYKFNSSNPCACDYIDRAIRMFKRKWIGDVYFAARDYLLVTQEWPENEHAYIGLIECLIAMKWIEEATNWIQHFKDKFPTYVDNRQIKRLQNALSLIVDEPPLAEDIEILSSMKVTDDEKALRLDSHDYERRYIGHCNTTTDIKEANFLGDNGDFICAGSDDGRIFIWDTKTTNLLTSMKGDVSIVNCVQPHPNICYLASSGIDPAVKIWSPIDEEHPNKHEKPWAALELNQDRMLMNPFETMFVNMGYSVRDSPSATQLASCRTS